MSDEGEIHIDASTFQTQLVRLAEVLAQKAKREAPSLLPPSVSFIAADLHVLIRQAMVTYNFLFYLNADERRQEDFAWRNYYSIVTLPLIRNMIDCLYNVILLLENPGLNGPWFRKSGFKKRLHALKEDEQRYGGQQKWDDWIRRNREALDLGIRSSGFKMHEVLNERPWPTLGKYIATSLSPQQQFLRTLLYGHWRTYSAMAHGAFEGLLEVALFYTSDSVPHEQRAFIDDTHPKVLFEHIGRAAGVLLCIITELQAYFRFDDAGARINERIHEMWNVLLPVFEVKEMYNDRYLHLVKTRGINP